MPHEEAAAYLTIRSAPPENVAWFPHQVGPYLEARWATVAKGGPPGGPAAATNLLLVASKTLDTPFPPLARGETAWERELCGPNYKRETARLPKQTGLSLI